MDLIDFKLTILFGTKVYYPLTSSSRMKEEEEACSSSQYCKLQFQYLLPMAVLESWKW